MRAPMHPAARVRRMKGAPADRFTQGRAYMAKTQAKSIHVYRDSHADTLAGVYAGASHASTGGKGMTLPLFINRMRGMGIEVIVVDPVDVGHD